MSASSGGNQAQYFGQNDTISTITAIAHQFLKGSHGNKDDVEKIADNPPRIKNPNNYVFPKYRRATITSKKEIQEMVRNQKVENWTNNPIAPTLKREIDEDELYTDKRPQPKVNKSESTELFFNVFGSRPAYLRPIDESSESAGGKLRGMIPMEIIPIQHRIKHSINVTKIKTMLRDISFDISTKEIIFYRNWMNNEPEREIQKLLKSAYRKVTNGWWYELHFNNFDINGFKGMAKAEVFVYTFLKSNMVSATKTPINWMVGQDELEFIVEPNVRFDTAFLVVFVNDIEQKVSCFGIKKLTNVIASEGLVILETKLIYLDGTYGFSGCLTNFKKVEAIAKECAESYSQRVFKCQSRVVSQSKNSDCDQMLFLYKKELRYRNHDEINKKELLTFKCINSNGELETLSTFKKCACPYLLRDFETPEAHKEALEAAFKNLLFTLEDDGFLVEIIKPKKRKSVKI